MGLRNRRILSGSCWVFFFSFFVFNRRAASLTLLFLLSPLPRTLHSPLKEFMGSQGNVWTSVTVYQPAVLWPFWVFFVDAVKQLKKSRCLCTHSHPVLRSPKETRLVLLVSAVCGVGPVRVEEVVATSWCGASCWRRCWLELLVLAWVCYDSVNWVFSHLNGKAKDNWLSE